MYIPINYGRLNNINSAYIPSNVKYMNTKVFNYWCRSLFQRAMSIIDIKVPEEWNGAVKDFLYYCLFRFGYVGVYDDENRGLVFQPGTLSGFDFYYQPYKLLVSNPAYKKSLELVIGETCEIMKLTPDYLGIWDIICYHAEKLASLDSGINMSIINSKLAWVLGAKNKSVAQTLKKIFDKIQRGDPLVIHDAKLADDPVSKSEPWQFLERQSIKNSYITTDLLKDFQTVLNNFDTEIGIPTIPYQKSERMVTSEADSKELDSTSRSLVWKNTLTESFKDINNHFGLDLSCKLRFDPDEQQAKEEAGGNENE